MREGWHGEDYLILFDEAEIATASDRYALERFLPGFKLLGLRSWDDLLVRDIKAQTYSVPAVPLDPRYLSFISLPGTESTLRVDSRFAGKIKWYVQPIVLGGDAGLGENLIWVSHKEHAQLVKWWNDSYRVDKGPRSL